MMQLESFCIVGKGVPVVLAASIFLATTPPLANPLQADTRELRRTCFATVVEDRRDAIITACGVLIDRGGKASDLARLHHNRGFAILDGDDYREAIPDLEAAVRLDPTVAEAFVALASAHHLLNETEEVMPFLDQAEALRPGWWRPNYSIGMMRVEHGDIEGAIRSLRRAVSTGGDAHAQNGLCWVLATANEALDDARRACDRALRDQPYNPAFLDSRALVKLRQGDFAGSEEDYISAYAINREQAPSLYGRGIARIRLGRIEAGEQDLASALAKDPTVADQFAAWGIRP